MGAAGLSLPAKPRTFSPGKRLHGKMNSWRRRPARSEAERQSDLRELWNRFNVLGDDLALGDNMVRSFYGI